MRVPMYVMFTKKQFIAKEEIIRLESRMKWENDPQKLYKLFCTASNIWNENFGYIEAMVNFDFVPDHEKAYREALKRINKTATA